MSAFYDWDVSWSLWSQGDRTGPYAQARQPAQHALVNPLHELRHFQRHRILGGAEIQMKIRLKIGSVKLMLFTIY